MTSKICNPLCDVVQRETIISATNDDSTVTVRVLYWGVECMHWHIININSIGFAYPTRYQDFDRRTVLTGIDSPDSYYLDTDTLEVPRAGTKGDKSSYILCYLNQADYTMMRNVQVHGVRLIYLESLPIHTEHCGQQDNPIHALPL